MFCNGNVCEILWHQLRGRCSEASASSVLNQPPNCRGSEPSAWRFTRSSSVSCRFSGSGITVSYPQYVPCIVKIHMEKHAAVLLSKAVPKRAYLRCLTWFGDSLCVDPWLSDWAGQPSLPLLKEAQMISKTTKMWSEDSFLPHLFTFSSSPSSFH